MATVAGMKRGLAIMRENRLTMKAFGDCLKHCTDAKERRAAVLLALQSARVLQLLTTTSIVIDGTVTKDEAVRLFGGEELMPTPNELDDDLDMDDRDGDGIDCPQCGLDAIHGLDHCRMCAAAMCRHCSSHDSCPVCGGDPGGL